MTPMRRIAPSKADAPQSDAPRSLPERPLLSIVSPVYKAENIVDELVSRIIAAVLLLTPSFEIVLVEDGSPDGSWEAIERNCQKDARVKGVKLSRNFGQHRAVAAGIHQAQGDAIIIMDCDLQDDPSDIAKLYKEAQAGYDVVFTHRVGRKHNPVKVFGSSLYNALFRFISDKHYDVNVGSLTLLSQKVRRGFIQLRDEDYIQMIKWLGFKTTTVPVEHHARYEGESSYSFGKLLSMGVQGLTSYSTKLLQLSIYAGLTVSFSCAILAVYLTVRYFMHNERSEWASLAVLVLLCTGLIVTSIGITGIYIGKIFMSVKMRPLFIVDETLNADR